MTRAETIDLTAIVTAAFVTGVVAGALAVAVVL